MEPLKLILTCAMVVASFGVHAQDTTKLFPRDQTTSQTQVQKDQANFKKDMIIISAAEIPAYLRATLQKPQYKGWENGTLYRNQTSDMFMVELRDGGQSRIFRFDQNGKPVKDF